MVKGGEAALASLGFVGLGGKVGPIASTTGQGRVTHCQTHISCRLGGSRLASFLLKRKHGLNGRRLLLETATEHTLACEMLQTTEAHLNAVGVALGEAAMCARPAAWLGVFER